MMSRALAPILRRAIAESAIWAAVVTVVRRTRRTRERIIAGLGGRWSAQCASDTSQKLNAVASDSRLINGLSTLFNLLSIAWADCRVKRWADPIVGVVLLERIRMFGLIMIIAVVTHTVLLAALGVPVREVGWGIRVLLLAAGLFAIKHPRPFAAAWNHRIAQPRKGHRT
jgi:hypothetical protein